MAVTVDSRSWKKHEKGATRACFCLLESLFNARFLFSSVARAHENSPRKLGLADNVRWYYPDFRSGLLHAADQLVSLGDDKQNVLGRLRENSQPVEAFHGMFAASATELVVKCLTSLHHLVIPELHPDIEEAWRGLVGDRIGPFRVDRDISWFGIAQSQDERSTSCATTNDVR